MMWGSSDDVTVMLNHFKGEKIFDIFFIYNKEKPFENTNNPCCSVDEPEAELMHDVLQFLHRGILNLKYVLSHDWRCRSTAGNILKKLLSDFMSYIIIHIEVHSGNRVAQPFLQLSLCLAVLLSHPPNHHPHHNSQLRRNVVWLMTNRSKLLWRTFYSLRGNWCFLLCILRLGPNRAALPSSPLSLTIKLWLILAYITIQLEYPFVCDVIDSW